MLIDGHSIAYRAFFALPVENFSTQTGQHTNGVFGFTSMLINVLRDEKPTHLGVAFDVSRHTFRSEIYSEYKANRTTTPDEFRGQLDLVKEVLKALNISYLEKEGFEADDVIGTLATRAEAAGYDVLICTGDRDIFQLVSDNVTVLYPRKGVSDLARMTPQAVEERYFATPRRYPELAALVGESSDNLPGVPGVGPKTAAKWLEMYDGLENLAAHASELKGKAAEEFQKRVDDVLRNRQVNALVLDLELPLTIEDLVRRPWNREATHQLFDGLEFRVLRDRLLEALPNEDEVVPEGGFDLEAARLEPGELGAWLAEHAAGERTGVDIIGHWGSGTGDVTALSLAAADGAAAYVVVSELGAADDNALADWLSDPERHKAMHDAKGPLLAIWARGWDLAGLTSDTQIAAYLTRPDQRTFDLADLTIRYLKRELRVEGAPQLDDPNQLALDFGDDDSGAKVAAEASMVRARAVIDLADALDVEIEQRNGTSLLYGVELPLLRTLARMEQTGVAVDVDHLESLEAGFAATVSRAANDAYDVLGKQINLGSPKQLQVVLFEELGMPKTRRTRTWIHHRRGCASAALCQNGASVPGTPAGASGRYPPQTDCRRFAQGCRRRRPHSYDVRADHRGHWTALEHRPQPAEHSRFAPKRGDGSGRRFVVGEGYDALMSADYSQIEMRIMAHASEDDSSDRGVQVGNGLPYRHRVARFRRRSWPGHALASGPRSRQ
jgi:DNA polymerase-1